MTGIPLSAEDDRVSVLQWSSSCGWWVSDLTCVQNAKLENEICESVLNKHHYSTTTTATATVTTIADMFLLLQQIL